MIRVKYHVSIGYGPRTEIVEFEDGTTDEEIERDFQEWLANYNEYGWYHLEADDQVDI